MSQAADPRAKLSRAAVRWALTGVVVHHVTVARIAQALGVSWKSRQEGVGSFVYEVQSSITKESAQQ